MEAASAEALLDLAAAAARDAYAPYSGFRVGAALLARDGRVYRGCNLENASYGLAICAERAAVAGAVAHGQREFVALAVVGGDAECPPCGACRQVLAEFCGDDFPVLVRAGDGTPRELRLGDLLPDAFRLRP